MKPQQINKSISQLSQSYNGLSEDWQIDRCQIDELQLLKQKDYYNFFKEYENFNFEEIILGVISLKVDRIVLNGIRTQLKNNLKLYQKNKTKFEQFNTYKLFEFNEQQLFDSKLEVLYKDKADVEGFECKYPEEQ